MPRFVARTVSIPFIQALAAQKLSCTPQYVDDNGTLLVPLHSGFDRLAPNRARSGKLG